MVFLRAVISGSMAVCVFYALSKLPMSTAYSVQFSGPLFAAGLSTVVLGEKVGWKRWIGIAVGFGGILIILRTGITDFNTGYLASLAVAVLFACNAMILRTVGGGEPGGALVAAHVVGILGFSLPMLPSVYIEPDWPDLGWMFVTGLLMSSAISSWSRHCVGRRCPASPLFNTHSLSGDCFSASFSLTIFLMRSPWAAPSWWSAAPSMWE